MRRLTARVQGSAGSLQQARLQRMSDEDLIAQVVSQALALGMPEELAHGDPEEALIWGPRISAGQRSTFGR